jgi:Man1-Src1p-C-terminal domain
VNIHPSTAILTQRTKLRDYNYRLDGTLRLSSNSLARLPIRCALRRSARLTLARYRVEAAGAVALLALILFVRSYIRTLRSDSARVPTLVSTTLDRLATQAALHSQGVRPEPWISAARLRDDVLRTEFSAKRREEIWRRVQKVVEVNANVRSSVREDRNGEVSRVWEWIGSLPAVDDGYADERRRSGRQSLLEDRDTTPDRHGHGEVQARKWDEGRPIY